MENVEIQYKIHPAHVIVLVSVVFGGLGIMRCIGLIDALQSIPVVAFGFAAGCLGGCAVAEARIEGRHYIWAFFALIGAAIGTGILIIRLQGGDGI